MLEFKLGCYTGPETGLTGPETGLTGPSGGSVLGGHEQQKIVGSAQTGLTGLETGLTGHSESSGKKIQKRQKRKAEFQATLGQV